MSNPTANAYYVGVRAWWFYWSLVSLVSLIMWCMCLLLVCSTLLQYLQTHRHCIVCCFMVHLTYILLTYIHIRAPNTQYYVVLWCRADIEFQILPKNHPTHPRHFVLTYFESRTKNNQGGYRGATRPRNREDPKVVADPDTMCPVTHLIARFLEYKSKVPPNRTCQKLMLQPNPNHKVCSGLLYCFLLYCFRRRISVFFVRRPRLWQNGAGYCTYLTGCCSPVTNQRKYVYSKRCFHTLFHPAYLLHMYLHECTTLWPLTSCFLSKS
jgi:hypothetical protein